MDESELLSYITNEERAALGYHTGELAADREKSLKYYLQEPLGNEVEGRSQYVDSTVRDTIEWALPDLLDIFMASGKAVEFEPTGLEDVEACRQATDACNYVLFKQNNGFLVFYEWFKSALLEKNGYVKYYYEEKKTRTKETYYGLTDEQLAMLVADDNVEVLEHSEYPDQAFQQLNPAQQMQMGGQVPMLHDVRIEVSKDDGKVCVEALPPEEILISSRHKSISIQGCTFVEHRSQKTQSELKEMGYSDKDLEDIGAEDDISETSGEFLARRRYTEEELADDRRGPQRQIWCKEAYARVDYDGDGISELRRVFIAGNKILDNEETDHIPIAAITPSIMPHRHIGQSLSELVEDLQLLISTLWRQILDNLYLTNNPRHTVLATQGGMAYANLDDLLTSRPGGVVRIYQPEAVQQLETKPVAAASFPMLEYLDQKRINRTGINQLSSGLDADAINKTARGAVLAQNQMARKIKLIARVLAETGVKDLFKGILYMLNKYSMKPLMVRLNNQFVPVDPRNWNTGWDMTVTVGLGTGDKEQEMMHLQLLGTVQKELLMAGKTNIVNDKNLYNLAGKMAEYTGFKHKEEFFTDPETQPVPQPPPDPKMMEIQADMQMTQMKLQADQQKSIGEASVEKLLKEIESQAQIAVAQIQAQTQLAIKQMELAAESAMKDKELRADAELEIFKANNDATIKQAELEDKDKDRALQAAVQSETLKREDQKLKIEDKKAEQVGEKARPARKEDVKKSDAVVDGVVKALNTVTQAQSELIKSVSELKKEVSRPRKRMTKALRDKEGNLVGAETVEE